MATNVLYPKAKERMISGSAINLAGNTVFCTLVSSSYTYNAAHVLYASSVGGYQVGTTGTLGSKTFTNGTFDAADITFSSVPATSNVTQLVIFQSGAGTGSDLLIAHFVSSSGAAIDVSTNDGDITINWNSSGIFSL